MNEKRTFGEFIKENKGKIVKGAIVVVGVAVGVLAIKLLANREMELIEGAVENLNSDGLTEGLKVIGDTVTNI